MSLPRRSFIRSLCSTATVFSLDQLLSGQSLDVEFVSIAREAGLKTKTLYGSENRNKYLLESTGCGAAFYDYDHDGWLDIFLVNGTRFESKWTAANAPVSRLYKNNRDGTFTDVTVEAGIGRTGWGAGCCVGDFDNDGLDDLQLADGSNPIVITKATRLSRIAHPFVKTPEDRAFEKHYRMHSGKAKKGQ